MAAFSLPHTAGRLLTWQGQGFHHSAGDEARCPWRTVKSCFLTTSSCVTNPLWRGECLKPNWNICRRGSRRIVDLKSLLRGKSFFASMKWSGGISIFVTIITLCLLNNKYYKWGFYFVVLEMILICDDRLSFCLSQTSVHITVKHESLQRRNCSYEKWLQRQMIFFLRRWILSKKDDKPSRVAESSHCAPPIKLKVCSLKQAFCYIIYVLVVVHLGVLYWHVQSCVRVCQCVGESRIEGDARVCVCVNQLYHLLLQLNDSSSFQNDIL